MTDTAVSILFLCTGNSARSILAEAIANCVYGDALHAQSAGSKPKGEPNRLALATLQRHGLPVDQWRSQSWTDFANDDHHFDLVVTLCDSAARESCPVFPGSPLTIHWGFPDPPAADDPEAMFEHVYQGLVQAIGAFVNDDDDDDTQEIALRAKRVASLVADRFPAAQVI